MIVFALLGCTVATTTDEIDWSGYIYTMQQNGDFKQIEAGTMTILDPTGEILIEGEQPYPDSPAYWNVTVPLAQQGQEIAIRLTAENSDTMLWRGRSPTSKSIWLGGSLYTHTKAYNQYLFAALSNDEVEPLADGEVAHLYGKPLVPETWANAQITLFDGSGNSHQVQAFSSAEDETFSTEIAEKIDFFCAFNIEPGILSLQVILQDGTEIVTDYPANGGDLISAINFAP